jgi:hypothetical protein
LVRPRQPRYVEAGEWYVPDLRDVVASREWTEHAACIGQDELFCVEGSSVSRPPRLTSPLELLRLLYCQGCSVRVECLLASLAPPSIPALVDTEALNGSPLKINDGVPHEWGTWGGADDRDRKMTEHLPLEERAELLEATFPERLRIRSEAWRESVRWRIAHGKGVFDRDRLVGAILGEDIPARKDKELRPKLFTAGGRGGPGRGHRSEIGLYAAAEGISYATAWRRLKAA